MDSPLYTTISCFLFRWLHIFVTKKTVISPLLDTFPKTLALSNTWEVRARDWEGNTHKTECQGGQQSPEGHRNTGREESSYLTSN